uniref:Kinetochore protein Nuf2 N-terminal domain-containing protein n=1 Tax=Trieres chinensis TaxID=1514140 RepID=A0A7S1ZLE0_TRICV|mmetsp:Transcript_2809/g.6051  ORF Transcript_2809/g.6051 Transcript_2809/m.6051 type:complete len:451 (+) Transcript_2809:158-1510(+)
MDLTGNHQQTPSFPILKNGDILQCMSEIGIDLTQDVLKEPHRHKDRVRETFLVLIEMGLGMTEERLRSPSGAIIEKRKSLAYPEMHEESLSELKFLKATMKLMRICGLHDFGWKDLHAPTSKCLRRQLSGAINFARFREEHMSLFDELNSQRDDYLGHLQDSQEENAKLSLQLEEAKMTMEEVQNDLEEVENECAEIEREIAQQNKLQATIRQESTDLKKKANDLKDKLATTALSLQEAEAEEGRLSSQVVASPDRIKKEMMSLSESLERERRRCSEAEKDSNIAQKKTNNVTIAMKSITASNALMDELDEVMSNHKAALIKRNTIIEEITVNKEKTAELVKQENVCETNIRQIERKIMQVRRQGAKELEGADKRLADAEEELLLVKRDREEGMAQIEAGEAEVRILKEKMEEDKVKADAEIADMIREYRHLESVIIEKNQELLIAIGAC